MKFALILALLPVSAFADERPPEWSLPNRGKGCTQKEAFHAEKVICGIPAYELWSCTQGGAVTEYLIVGEFSSDVLDSCSPTFVVKSVEPQVRAAK